MLLFGVSFKIYKDLTNLQTFMSLISLNDKLLGLFQIELFVKFTIQKNIFIFV
jgi:hypothetical protein